VKAMEQKIDAPGEVIEVGSGQRIIVEKDQQGPAHTKHRE